MNVTDTSHPGPEYRLVADLRQDMFRDVFAYRPLPPMRTDGPLTRRLSGTLRAYASWTPHATVVAAGLIAMAAGYTAADGDAGFGPLLCGLLALLPVLATLIRPVAAFWFSMAAAPVVAVFGGASGDWPWAPGSFVAQVTVMTVVALRSRPRVAAWMWLLTAAFSMVSEALFGGGYYGSNTFPLLFVSALALLVVTVRTVRRAADEEVTAHQSETAQERSRRTLLEERTTIARELHDVVAHHMSVVAIQAEAAPYRVQNPPPELEQAFVTIRENAVAALTELRRVLGVVRAEDYEAPDAPQPTLA
ncbi:sensor histidine kinase, partial [Streptomyces halstedii]|uniref:sensor histidine kinase n=2 Tax=Streptomyces TaxID=1883 RepID=UPI003D9F4B9D